jgi:hypothetical protein
MQIQYIHSVYWTATGSNFTVYWYQVVLERKQFGNEDDTYICSFHLPELYSICLQELSCTISHNADINFFGPNYPDEIRGKLDNKNFLTVSATVCWK